MQSYVANGQSGLELDTRKFASGLQAVHMQYIEPDKAEHMVYPYAMDRVELPKDEPKMRQNPFGLRPLWFGLLIGIVTALVVGAIVGGGVSAAMATDPSKCGLSAESLPSDSPQLGISTTSSSTTATSSATTIASPLATTSTPALSSEYAPIAPQDVKLLAHPCPAQDYNYQINGDPFPLQTFKWECQTAYLGNGRADVGITLMQLSAYTAEQCVEACGGLNAWRNEFICTAVTFQAAMSAEYINGRGNCWLFNSTQGTWDDPGAQTCISAFLSG